jgi:hypothetical protein
MQAQKRKRSVIKCLQFLLLHFHLVFMLIFASQTLRAPFFNWCTTLLPALISETPVELFNNTLYEGDTCYHHNQADPDLDPSEQDQAIPKQINTNSKQKNSALQAFTNYTATGFPGDTIVLMPSENSWQNFPGRRPKYKLISDLKPGDQVFTANEYGMVFSREVLKKSYKIVTCLCEVELCPSDTKLKTSLCVAPNQKFYCLSDNKYEVGRWLAAKNIKCDKKVFNKNNVALTITVKKPLQTATTLVYSISIADGNALFITKEAVLVRT